MISTRHQKSTEETTTSMKLIHAVILAYGVSFILSYSSSAGSQFLLPPNSSLVGFLSSNRESSPTTTTEFTVQLQGLENELKLEGQQLDALQKQIQDSINSISNSNPSELIGAPARAADPVSAPSQSEPPPAAAAVLVAVDNDPAVPSLRERRKLLLALLERESELIRSRFPHGLDFTSPHVRYLGTHDRAQQMHASVESSIPLTTALTESYLGLRQTPFTIGFTGGSASAGVDVSYPALIGKWFHTQLNMSVEARNGAQGATSQLQTSGCIYQTVGDKTVYSSNATDVQNIDTQSYLQAEPVDLLVWEFAINDESGAQLSDAALRDHHRKIVAEAYVRGSFTAKRRPLAIGFVHLWDPSVQEWQNKPNLPLPDRGWKPTNEVLSYYSQYMDAFAVNVIRFIAGHNCLDGNTSVILSPPPANCVSACAKCSYHKAIHQQYFRDRSHPNGAGYNTTRDFFLHTLLDLWMEALRSEVNEADHVKSSDAQSHHKPALHPLTLPYLTPNHVHNITIGMRSACIVGVEPLMAPPDPHLRFECDASSSHSEPPTSGISFYGSSQVVSGFHSVCPAAKRTRWGRHADWRADRKISWAIPTDCSATLSGAKLPIHLDGMHRLRHLIIECSLLNCQGLTVQWANRTLTPNVNTTDTMYADTLGWIHQFSAEDTDAFLGKTSTLHLSECQPDSQSRSITLTRLIVWYDHQD